MTRSFLPMFRLRTVLLTSLAALAVLVTGCGRDTPQAPDTSGPVSAGDAVPHELAAGEIVLASDWGFDANAELPVSLMALLDANHQRTILGFSREIIVDDIAHYSIRLSVGPGEYDVIGLHRVVRESRPNVPIRTKNNLFLVHGAGKDFVGNFLDGKKSPILPDDLGFAVYLARNDVDVWGIDSRYLLVPPGLGDLGFVGEWSLETYVDDLQASVAIARFARAFTGSGFGKMALGGYSAGSIMSYVLLDRETQRPLWQRNVGAYVTIDFGLVPDTPELAARVCEDYAAADELVQQGIVAEYDDPDGFFLTMGTLARENPDGPSPLFEGFTNLEVLLYFTVFDDAPFTAHFWAGVFDGEGNPLSFTFSSLERVAEFWVSFQPIFQPYVLNRDNAAILCPDIPSPSIANLGEIAIPVLSIEPAGGYAPDYEATLGLLSSATVERITIQQLGSQDALLDYGHVDIFTGDAAEGLWFAPTLDWVERVCARHGTGVRDDVAAGRLSISANDLVGARVEVGPVTPAIPRVPTPMGGPVRAPRIGLGPRAAHGPMSR